MKAGKDAEIRAQREAQAKEQGGRDRSVQVGPRRAAAVGHSVRASTSRIADLGRTRKFSSHVHTVFTRFYLLCKHVAHAHSCM